MTKFENNENVRRKVEETKIKINPNLRYSPNVRYRSMSDGVLFQSLQNKIHGLHPRRVQILNKKGNIKKAIIEVKRILNSKT